MNEDVWQSGWFPLQASSFWLLAVLSLVVAILAHHIKDKLTRDIFSVLFCFYLYAVSWFLFKSNFTTEVAYNLLAVLYVLYAGLLVVVCVLKSGRAEIIRVAAFSSVLPIVLSLFAITSSEWEQGIFHTSFLTLFLIFVVSLGLAVFLSEYKGQFIKLIEKIQILFVWSAGLYGVVLIWLSSHALFVSDSQAVSVSLFVYVTCGLVVYISGRYYGSHILRVAATVLLSGVVLRLVIVDVWSMDLPFRVLTFAGIGILFLGTSFVETSLANKEKKTLSTTDTQRVYN
jgi:hypothetical protein